MRKLLLVAATLAAALPLAAADAGHWATDFEQGTLDGWALTIPSDWKIVNEQGNHVLRLDKAGPVGANPRRPVKIALWKPGCVSSFELNVRVKRDPILKPETESDALVVFGFQDKLHFYYSHLSSDDGYKPVHNGLFRVNGGQRERIAGTGSRPALPDEKWHHVRVVRDVASGKIQLFVDDESEPRFQVVDHTHGFGLVGVGSFDNTAEFDDLSLKGTPSAECHTDDIQTLDVP